MVAARTGVNKRQYPSKKTPQQGKKQLLAKILRRNCIFATDQNITPDRQVTYKTSHSFIL